MSKYEFHSLCKPVEGFLRTAVYDFQLNDYYFMFGDADEVLQNPGEHEKQIDNLLQHRAVFQSDESCTFSAVSNEAFDYPSLITNAVLEIDVNTNGEHLIRVINELHCYNVQLIFTDSSPAIVTKIDEVISIINQSAIKHCELVIHYNLYSGVEKYCNKYEYPEMQFVYVHSSPENKYVASKPMTASVLFLQAGMDLSLQHKKSINFFEVNYALYAESRNFNTYYNRKIFIDRLGNIKNGPLSAEILDNVYDNDFSASKLLSHASLKKLWNVSKDMINVCNVCEYRHMCVDGRIPQQHTGSDLWYHTSECNYNPFIAKWEGSDGYKTLAECGVNVSAEDLQIDYSILKEEVKGLYSLQNS